MKPIRNTQRSPQKGDWIKLETWDNFFQVSRIKAKEFDTGFGIEFVGYTHRVSDDYDINLNWVYQDWVE